MSVTYAIRFAVVPEQRQRLLGLLQDVLDAMRAEANFRDAALHEDPEDQTRFLLVETWAEHQDVLDVQLHRPYRQAWHAALPDLLAAPREISVWRRLRVDRE
jgi:quinol monooxygenase YgiN